jgi:hypothetical protein
LFDGKRQTIRYYDDSLCAVGFVRHKYRFLRRIAPPITEGLFDWLFFFLSSAAP